MKLRLISRAIITTGRAPHGARGLKQTACCQITSRICRAPHGARGLKRNMTKIDSAKVGRAPHGARGLKHHVVWHNPARPVAPRTGRAD